MSHEKQKEHGTVESYVTGFILSLIFTFIPYYLVVNQTVTGTVLLATILGFGVLQMIVQVTFFLHLGRGPKPNWNFFFFVSTISLILVVVGGSMVITNNLHGNMTPADKTKKLVDGEGIYQIGGEITGACQGHNTNHQVVIQNGQVSPLHTVAAKCDTLTFINKDDAVLEITFGTHPAHEAYAGQYELLVSNDRAKSITLSEAGTFKFHDHLNPYTYGELLVTP